MTFLQQGSWWVQWLEYMKDVRDARHVFQNYFVIVSEHTVPPDQLSREICWVEVIHPFGNWTNTTFNFCAFEFVGKVMKGVDTRHDLIFWDALHSMCTQNGCTPPYFSVIEASSYISGSKMYESLVTSHLWILCLDVGFYLQFRKATMCPNGMFCVCVGWARRHQTLCTLSMPSNHLDCLFSLWSVGVGWRP